jgi:hypothetical protein
LVVAVTRRAGPSQRIRVSYQIPIVSTLLPLSTMSCCQWSGASSTKLLCANIEGEHVAHVALGEHRASVGAPPT